MVIRGGRVWFSYESVRMTDKQVYSCPLTFGFGGGGGEHDSE